MGTYKNSSEVPRKPFVLPESADKFTGAYDTRNAGQRLFDSQMEAAREQNPELFVQNPLDAKEVAQNNEQIEQNVDDAKSLDWRVNFINDVNATQQQLNKEDAEYQENLKSEDARRRIGAYADAISAIGNFFGVANNGYNMPEPKAYAMVNQKIADDRNLRRANIQMLQNRLNSQMNALLGAERNRLSEERLNYYNRKEDNLNSNRIAKLARAVENDRVKNEQFMSKLGLDQQKADETNRHNTVQEGIAQQKADAQTLTAAKYNTGGSKGTGNDSGATDAEKERKKQINNMASKENWAETQDKLASLFGKTKWKDVQRPGEDNQELRKLHNDIVTASTQKEKEAIVEKYFDKINNPSANAVDDSKIPPTKRKKATVDNSKVPPTKRK